MHHITEDTPPDMLAGAMDLSVRLPDGRDVQMSVERSTPMMDLLVQVTTAYKLRPSEHIVQALDMLAGSGASGERALPYKPNTPIGALDTQRIRVLPKGKPPAPRVPPPPGHQPFESTFRLQVHLPRNQFCVIRVGKHVMLEDIMRKVCEEKNLDPHKYEFRHPANIDKVLDPKRTLNDYEITEITVVHRGSSQHLSQTISSSDIMALQREEERRKQTKTGGGVLNLIFRRGRTSMGSGSVSSDTRSISPTQSDDSRSVTPPAVQPPQILPAAPRDQKQVPSRPKPPQRKRRPAPKPPAPAPTLDKQQSLEKSPPPVISESAKEIEKCQPDVAAKLENGLTICHSRNSSDSSGYHEASILSDNCNTTLPRRPKSTVLNSSLTNSTLSMDKSMDFRKSTGNLTNMTLKSVSTTSLTNAGRKKKAPPPPPTLKTASSVANISTVTSSSVPVVASNTCVEPTQKSLSDISTPSSMSVSSECVPKPKPRTAISPLPLPVPVPTPRKVLTSNTSPPPDDTENRFLISQRTSENDDDEIAKLRRDSKFDTVGRKRGFQIGKSMLSMDGPQTDDPSTSDAHMSDNSSVKTLNSSSSSQNINEEHFNLEINNIDMFDSKRLKSNGKSNKNKKYLRHFHGTEVLAEIHDLGQNRTYDEALMKRTSNSSSDLPNNDSITSLRSVNSIPGFMGSNTNIKKWGNLQNLDGISYDSDDRSVASSHAWVVGDTSDAESTCPVTPSDLTSLPRASDASLQTVSLTSDFSQDPASFQSLDKPSSRISNVSDLSAASVPEEPQPVEKIVTSTPTRHELKKVPLEETVSTEEKRLSPSREKPVPVIEENIPKVKTEQVQRKASPPKLAPISILPEVEALKLDPVVELPKMELKSGPDDLETDWQYTLPSPPTAFRDSSPTNFTDMTNYDTVTFDGLASDSVVTSPALFEKLESIRDTRSDTATIVSESESTSSVQPQVLTSKYLSLETLEKRKSLVLERELASLKNAQSSDESLNKNANELDNMKMQRDNLRYEIEEMIQQNKGKPSNLSRSNSQSREKILMAATDSTLPNFKISTYDQPKGKINIFEDDSIRSNVENKSTDNSKRNSIADVEINSKSNFIENEISSLSKNKNSPISASTENIYFKRNSIDHSMDDFLFKRPQDPAKFKINAAVTNMNGSTHHDRFTEMVSRSESFSSQKNNVWSRTNPVKRSKSHISLDRYKDDNKTAVNEPEEGLHKSNSLFNVSGLQSLEVMRMILPKLGNTPPSTPPEDKKAEPFKSVQPKPEQPTVPDKLEIPEKETVVKKYQYSGPPAVNLGTWSERPKSQVSLKEDKDYKISNISAMKAKFNSQTNLNGVSETKVPQDNSLPQSYPSVNIRVNSNESKDQVDSGKINIKINAEPAKTISHQSSGNVIIKIGNNNESNQTAGSNQVKSENKLRENSFYSRFLNQTTAVGYRKPLGNINGVDKPRPHSIAFDALCPDLSRVPIVRAVELKKPYKDTQANKSVTQIIHDSPVTDASENIKNGSADVQHSPPVKSNTLGNQFRHSSVYLSSENLHKTEQNGPNKVLSLFSKPVSRGNSFAAVRTTSTPVVKGFRMPLNKDNDTETKKVTNWNNSNQYGTLPNKTNNFTNSHLRTSDNISFSQNMLKRVEIDVGKQPEKSIFETVTLRKTTTNSIPSYRHSMGPAIETNGSGMPPPPPQMPKITAVTKKPMQRQRQIQDPRDQLLESIRNFGGKSGLRAAK